MHTNEIIKGRWWVHGAEVDPLLGFFNYDSMTLTVSNPVVQSTEQILLEITKDERQSVPNMIAGRDIHNNPVTLFGASLAHHSSSGGFREWEINILAAVQGLEVLSWSQPLFLSVSVKPRLLNRWFDRGLVRTEHVDSGLTVFRPEELMDFDLPVEDGIRIRFHDGALSSVSVDEYCLRHDSQIWFHFENPISLSELTTRWLPWLTRLLGILIGRPIDLESVSVFTNDPYTRPIDILFQEGRLLRSKCSVLSDLDSTDFHSVFVLAPFATIRNQLPTIVKRWNNISRNLESVLDLFCAVAFHYSIYLEARFLNLVQALEIMHACSDKFSSVELNREEHRTYLSQAKEALPEHLWKWAGGKLSLNSRSLRQKLNDIFEAYAPYSNRLLGETNAAASRISYTRNHLTHHIDRPNKNRLIPDGELTQVSSALESILWVILLKEIGVEGDALERVVSRTEKMRFTSICKNETEAEGGEV